jgi:hypothetical protein
MVIALVVFAVLALPFVWPHRWLVRDGLKYLLRWPIWGGDGIQRAPWPLTRAVTNLFVHLIVLSDGPLVHSHPWDAKALILWGRYRDTRVTSFPGGRMHRCSREFGPGQINDIPAGAFHTLEILTPFVLTLCWTGRKHGKGWGFLINGQFINASGRGAAAYDEAKRAAGVV